MKSLHGAAADGIKRFACRSSSCRSSTGVVLVVVVVT